MMMEKKLKCQQAKVKSHQAYLLTLLNDNRVILLATLLPAFLWGWKQAREKKVSKRIQQVIKFVLVTVLTNVGKHAAIK